MRITLARRVLLVALTTLVALASVAPVAADTRPRKVEPRGVTTYRPGRVFTPSTDVLSTSGYAAWMIDEALGFTTPLPRLGAAFTRAERDEGINARYLVAHALLESGWGTSDIARLKRNLFGYNAFDRNPWRHASRFRTYREGIAAVASRIRAAYLTPGGRFWYRYPTLRAMNMYYASDVRWADKVAHLANVLDGLVVTLRERKLRFGRPALTEGPVVRRRVSLDVPWRAVPGAVLPPGIRFAARWTPLELVEARAMAPDAPPAPGWTLVRRRDRAGGVRLSLVAPSQPGMWRLDIEARDSDGRPLPKADRPAIRPLTVRVAAEREASISLVAGRDGMLEATIHSIGRGAIAAVRGPVATVVEAWALPLDPAAPAFRVAAVPLGSPLEAGLSRVIRFTPPALPAVIMVRLAGSPVAVGRGRPAVALVSPGGDGGPAAEVLHVASPRDDVLLARASVDGRITLVPSGDHGSVRVAVAGGPAAPLAAVAAAAAEETPGRPSLLVRSLAVEPGSSARPSVALLEIPAEPPSPASLEVTGLPAGIRLVLAGIVPADGGPVDVTSLRLAWIRVIAVTDAGAAPN